MKHCPNRDCPHARAVGAPAEFVADVTVCSDCGVLLEEGAAPEQVAPAVAAKPEVRRLAVTLGVMPVLFAMHWVTLPGIDVEALQAQLAAARASIMLLPRSTFSIFALGISPLLTAGVLIGLAGLIFPAWRWPRARPEVQRKLRWAMGAIALLLALAQASSIAQLLGRMGEIFNGSAAIVVLSLAAGTAVMIAGAELLSRHGLGNGYSLILFYGLLGRELEGITRRLFDGRDSPSAAALLLAIGAPAALVVVLVRVLGARPGRTSLAAGESTEGPAAYRLHADTAAIAAPERRIPDLRLPAGGMAPITVIATLYAISYDPLWRLLRLPDLAALQRSTAGDVAVTGALTMALGVGFVYVLRPASRVAAAVHAGSDGVPEASIEAARAVVRRAAVKSAALLAGVLVVTRLAQGALGGFPFATSFFLASAIGLDLVSEWRARRASADLVTVAGLDDMDAVEAALAALEAAEIPVHARGLHHRSLLQIFGPYVVVELMVPGDRVDEARAVLAPFTPDDGAQAEAQAAPKRRRKKRKKAPVDQRGEGASRET